MLVVDLDPGLDQQEFSCLEDSSRLALAAVAHIQHWAHLAPLEHVPILAEGFTFAEEVVAESSEYLSQSGCAISAKEAGSDMLMVLVDLFVFGGLFLEAAEGLLVSVGEQVLEEFF